MVERYKATDSILCKRALAALDGFQSGVAFREEGFCFSVLFSRGQAFSEGTLRNGKVVVAFRHGAHSNLQGLTQVSFRLGGPTGLVQNEAQNR